MLKLRDTTLSGLILCLASCAGAGLRGAPYVIIETESGEGLEFEEFINRVADADVIFLGEEHDNATCHELQHWTTIALAKRREVKLSLEHEGSTFTTTVVLGFDKVNYGRRAWLTCPECGSRRRDLFIDDGELRCRKCAGLLYYYQALPASSWRNEVALPLLRALRGTPWGRLPEQGWQ